MLVTGEIDKLRKAVGEARNGGAVVGVVMTMGALHAGHRTLIEAAVAECGFVVVTIYVNPTQFAPGEDFDAYPRPLDADLAVCREAGAAAVFTPTDTLLYPDGFQTSVTVEETTQPLEGASRPTHFRGVTTVVLKLLNIAAADRAYFGQKDYQQQAVLRQMATDLNHPTAICTVPTVRDADGVALSSRNAYLSEAERRAARALPVALSMAANGYDAFGQISAAKLGLELGLKKAADDAAAAGVRFEVDYAVVVDSVTLREYDTAEMAIDADAENDPVALLAVRVGSTRLIDNHRLRDAGPIAFEAVERPTSRSTAGDWVRRLVSRLPPP